MYYFTKDCGTFEKAKEFQDHLGRIGNSGYNVRIVGFRLQIVEIPVPKRGYTRFLRRNEKFLREEMGMVLTFRS